VKEQDYSTKKGYRQNPQLKNFKQRTKILVSFTADKKGSEHLESLQRKERNGLNYRIFGEDLRRTNAFFSQGGRRNLVCVSNRTPNTAPLQKRGTQSPLQVPCHKQAPLKPVCLKEKSKSHLGRILEWANEFTESG